MTDPAPLDPARIRRESLRWFLLLACNHARPSDLYENVLLATAQGMYPDATALEVRRELDYLEGRALVKIAREPAGRWRAALTRHGADIAEYTIDVEPGIARPAKYW